VTKNRRHDASSSQRAANQGSTANFTACFAADSPGIIRRYRYAEGSYYGYRWTGWIVFGRIPLAKGYEVAGIIRRARTEQHERIAHIQDRLELHEGDVLDQVSLTGVLQKFKPDEVYNLASQSSVFRSWAEPILTGEITRSVSAVCWKPSAAPIPK